jgi:hypothetical protein
VYDAELKAFPGKRRPMVMYDEVFAVAPYACAPGRPADPDTGMPELPDMVDHIALIPQLLAYVQSLETRLAALEAGKSK